MKKITNAFSFFGKTVKVRIDRPLHTKHPNCDIVYELNYGFVPGTLSLDGDALDCYLLGIDKPVKAGKGVCIAVIVRPDGDNKLVIAPKGKTYTKEQIKKLTYFQEKYFKSRIIMMKKKK